MNQLVTPMKNKGKFDIVAAMGMAELADEELSGLYLLKQKKRMRISGKTQVSIMMKKE